MDQRYHVVVVSRDGQPAPAVRRIIGDAGHRVVPGAIGPSLLHTLARTEPIVDAVVATGLDGPLLEELLAFTRPVDEEISIVWVRDGGDVPNTVGRQSDVLVCDESDLMTGVRWAAQRTALLRRNKYLLSRIEMLSAAPKSEVRETQDVAIFGLAKLVESRDQDTGNHLERMAAYSRVLAMELKSHPLCQGYITDEYITDIWRSAPLHDIGKVGVPDSILLKPGKLDRVEWSVMQTHSAIGGDTLREIERRMHFRSFLRMGRDIAYCHHEKWNGEGYPFGLRGDEIPLSARIVALADVYDALTSKRPYKEPFSHEKARSIIVEGAGVHFDPDVVTAFERAEDRVVEIAGRHQPEDRPTMVDQADDRELEIARYRRSGRRMSALRALVEGNTSAGSET